MPVYEYHCDKCNRAATISLSIREHDKGAVRCPKCGSKALRPLSARSCPRPRRNPDGSATLVLQAHEGTA
jgi:putative FmdB family regulatory protein